MSTLPAILDRAARYEAKHVQDLYYVEPDHGEHFCETCARKEPNVEDVCFGDPSAHHDTFPHCDRCGVTLCGWLTDWGAKDQLGYFEKDGFNAREGFECYLWMLCENSFLPASDEYAALLALVKMGRLI